MKINVSYAGSTSNKNLSDELSANIFHNCLTPHSKAITFRQQLDCKNPYLSLQLANQLNIIVDKYYFPEEINAVSFRINENHIIGINQLLEQDESNFVIAHEIGHIVLHSKVLSVNLKKDHNLNKSKFSAMDTEANMFACALLMPKNILNNKLKTLGIPELAKYFNVHKQAVRYNLKLTK